MGHIAIFIIIIAAVILLVAEAFSVDLISLMVLGTLLVFQLVSPEEAISGFSNPATVTVACMFVLSGGLIETGAIDRLASIIGSFKLTEEWSIILVMTIVVGTLSAFINNTAAIVVFLPVALKIAKEHDISPSKLLIPISYVAILGGTCTLVGTSTNIIVYDILQKRGITQLGMFEMAKLGIILASIGVVYIMLVGRKLLPERVGTTDLRREYSLEAYLTEVVLKEDSPLIGKTPGEIDLPERYSIDILGILREEQHVWIGIRNTILEEGDILLVRGDIHDILKAGEREGFTLLPAAKAPELEQDETIMVEAIVSRTSDLIGKTLEEIDFRRQYRAFVIAIKSHGKIVRNKLSEVKLGVGDTLLIQGMPGEIDKLFERHDFIITRDIELPEPRPGKSVIAVLIIAAVILLVTLNICKIVVAAILGSIAMVLSGCLTIQEAYNNIDWMVIFLLGGIIPLGIAMEQTGTAEMLAGKIVDLAGVLGPVAILSGFYLLTNALTELMSNNATALIIAPLAINTAHSLGVDPKPFALAVMFAASCSFMTPIGYQTNTLVYGPGGYKFTDYMKVGAPLHLILWMTATFLIPYFWPL